MRCLVLLAAATAACTAGPESLGDPLSDRDIPPRGFEDLTAWLDAGYYSEWHCEDAPHAPRPGGHGSNRICNNDRLYDARNGDGIWPVGAASVKEVFSSSGAIASYAVYRKVDARDGGDSWYWYEGLGDNVVANGEGETICTDCHSGAPRDFVFTVIPRSE